MKFQKLYPYLCRVRIVLSTAVAIFLRSFGVFGHEPASILHAQSTLNRQCRGVFYLCERDA